MMITAGSPGRSRAKRRRSGMSPPEAAGSESAPPLMARLCSSSLATPRVGDEHAALRIDLEHDLLTDLEKVRADLLDLHGAAGSDLDVVLREVAEIDGGADAAAHAGPAGRVEGDRFPPDRQRAARLRCRLARHAAAERLARPVA